MRIRRSECDRCGVAACDLPDGLDPEEVFEVVGDEELCGGCREGTFEVTF